MHEVTSKYIKLKTVTDTNCCSSVLTHRGHVATRSHWNPFNQRERLGGRLRSLTYEYTWWRTLSLSRSSVGQEGLRDTYDLRMGFAQLRRQGYLYKVLTEDGIQFSGSLSDTPPPHPQLHTRNPPLSLSPLRLAPRRVGSVGWSSSPLDLGYRVRSRDRERKRRRTGWRGYRTP